MLRGDQIRAARAMLRLEQKALADRAGISVETIRRIERDDGPIPAHARTADKLRVVLEGLGIEFTDGDAPGVRLRQI